MERNVTEVLTFSLAAHALAEQKGLAPALGDGLRLLLIGDETGPAPLAGGDRICGLLVVAERGGELPADLTSAIRDRLGDGRFLLALATCNGSGGTAPAEPGERADPVEPDLADFLRAWRFERVFRPDARLAGHGRVTFELNLPSDESLIPALSHAVGLLLREFGHPQDDWLSTIPLVIDELMTNAMRHGNGGCRDKHVAVRVQIDAGQFRLTVTDEGRGFRREGVADPRRPDRLWRPGGRGIFLIEALMDTVDYRDEGRTVEVVKRYEAPRDDAIPPTSAG